MKIILVVLLLAGGFTYAAAEINSTPLDKQPGWKGETAMEWSEGLFFVMGKVKGSRVGYFLIDLGASHTIVKRSAIDRKEPFDSSSLFNGNIPDIMGLRGKIKNIVGKTTLEYFKTGKIKMTEVPALVVDSLYDFGGKNVLGILGLDVLGCTPCLRLSMSEGRKTKYKLTMGECSGWNSTAIASDSLILENGFIVLPGSIDNRPIFFILDTGSKHSFISPDFARRYNIIPDSNYIIVYQGLDNVPDTAMTAHVSAIHIGSTGISRIGLLVGNIPRVAGESFATDGIIGTDLLRRFQSLEMDFGRGHFKLTP